MELKAHLGDAEERGVVLELLHDLRGRSDITEVVAREIDRLVAEESPAPHGSMRHPEVAPDADPGAARVADSLVEPTGTGHDAETRNERDATRVGRVGAEHATDGDIVTEVARSRHRRRRPVIFAALGVVIVLTATAFVALTRGGQDSNELDVESASSNFQAIIDETVFDDEGSAFFRDCPLGDIRELAHAVDDVVPLSTETLEGDTYSGGEYLSDDVPSIHCAIEAADRGSTDGIWAFTAHSIGSGAQGFDGYEVWGDYRSGRIVQEETTEDGGDRLCTSYWLTDDADIVFAVELYGDGCTLEASSEALSAVLPDLVGALA
jgi:hypothetical protein